MIYFWEDIGELVVDYINYAYTEGKLFITQRRGVIILIPKHGDQKLLRNKRPICLLDIVYKIIAKVLAIRLGSVVKGIINPDQTGFLKGRCIQDNLRLIQDVIDYTYKDRVPGIICALDFRAAFNSLEHEFIFFALEKFGFGESFIKWVKLLYNDTERSILNNGYTSQWFSPKRGIMQGCPISGLLFSLAVELLAIKIRTSSAISGIVLSHVEFKITQYADDTTVFVKDEPSVDGLMKVLKDFAKVSGLELNMNKSKLMRVGSSLQSTGSVCGISSVKRVKILGIWFSATENCEGENIDSIIDGMKVTMNMWRQRGLSIKGRITLSKSLLISKFIYAMSCVSIQASQIRVIQSHIMKFIWRGRPPKVAAKVLCQSISDGGLGAVDVNDMYSSLKLSWVKKMYQDTPWAKLLQARCSPISVMDLLKCRYVQSDLKRFALSEFYVDLLTTFRKVTSVGLPIDPSQIGKELLWLNSAIKCDKRAIFDKNMYECGIKTVGDIVSERGTIMNFAEMKRKYPGIRVNFLRFLSIVSAIPRSWKNNLRSQRECGIDLDEREGPPKINIGDKIVNLGKLQTKDFYWLIRKTVKPNAITKWEREDVNPDNWSRLFLIPYICTRSTKLQAFQYQIIHRYIPTRKFLYVRKVIDSPRCERCNDIDTLMHHFCSCPAVVNFWESVFGYINDHLSEPIQRNNHNIIFGIADAPSVVNLLVIIGKHFIHSNAVQRTQLVFHAYLAYVKDVYQTERRAAVGCVESLNKLSKKWELFPLLR